MTLREFVDNFLYEDQFFIVLDSLGAEKIWAGFPSDPLFAVESQVFFHEIKNAQVIKIESRSLTLGEKDFYSRLEQLDSCIEIRIKQN